MKGPAMNILIVDDDQSYRRVLELFLQSFGWIVYSAIHGADGLEKLRANKIDLIISDVYMPVMDGLKFHKAVRAIPEFASIPFLFVSGFDDDHTREAVGSPKGSGFLKKSAPPSQLKEKLEQMLKKAK
jgi:two-component system chemotaxis response regulator CheY